MKMMVTGRHIEMDDQIKAYAERKLQKAETYFDHIIEAHIVLSAEKHRRTAEVTLNAKNVTIHANEETDDIYNSIDGVMEKVDAQVKKYKERVKDHKHRIKGAIPELQDVETDLDSDSEDDIKQEKEIQIVKVRKFAPKPMTTQEAVMQIKLLDNDFLVFSNSQTNQVNVVYKRKDGTYGWIEPDFE
ncbi:MAG: putative sigma-54 modulation protein [Candidatus Poribacteria bacterium]|nr:putative sigma-54 modulation protein [Candidatus Poribacteria bacterium]